MNHPDPTYQAAVTWPQKIVHYGLQPAALIAILLYWLSDPADPLTFAVTIGLLHLALGTLERWMPARPGWRIGGVEQLRNVILVVVLTLGIGMVGGGL